MRNPFQGGFAGGFPPGFGGFQARGFPGGFQGGVRQDVSPEELLEMVFTLLLFLFSENLPN